MGAHCDFYTTPLITMALTILFVVLFSFFPESPKFLIKQNRLSVSIKYHVNNLCTQSFKSHSNRNNPNSTNSNPLMHPLDNTFNYYNFYRKPKSQLDSIKIFADVLRIVNYFKFKWIC